MKSKGTLRWRLFLAFCFAWGSAVTVLYAAQIPKLPAFRLRELYTYSLEFFLWQCLGFVMLVLIPTLIRPAVVGRLCAVYLAISTMTVLILALDWWLPLGFVVFTLWCLSAVNTCRLAIRCVVGVERATWGLATAGLYGAAIALTFFLGLFKIMTAAWIALLALVVALPGALDHLRELRSRLRSMLHWFDSLGPVGASALQVLWLCLALAFVWAETPETASDSIRQHLPYVQHVARHGGFEVQAVNFGRLKPKPVQAVAAAGYALGGYRLAKWVSWIVLVALAQLIYEEISKRSRRRDLGLLAASAIVSCPLLLYISTTLYIDHAMVFLCLASFISLLRGLHGSHQGSVLFSAFLMGATAQTKYNALIFLVIWSAFLATYAIGRFGFFSGLKWCLMPAAVVAVSSSPWYIYTFATTGSPLFPYFNDWFQSPFWPAGMSTRFSLDKLYTLGDNVWDRILFPWTITFHSSRFSHHHDGGLGFVLLALTPMVIAIRRRPFHSGLDLGIAGVAITVGVCSYTPFARYWLAGLPLMIMPLFLFLGGALDKARLRPPPALAALAAACVMAAFILQVPFWTADWRGYPWDVYVNELPEEKYLAKRFRGYAAVQKLNSFLRPGDRVLSTGYDAINTIGGSAYEFPFWHKNINRLSTPEALEGYLRKHDIRYWAVNLAGSDARFFKNALAAGVRYWSDSRLVSASSTLAVFDVSVAGPWPPLVVEASYELPPLLVAKSARRASAAEMLGWQDMHARRPAKASRETGDRIEIPNLGAVRYRFRAPAGTHLVRARVPLRGRLKPAIVLTLIWSNEEKEQIDLVTTVINGRWKSQEVDFFAAVPARASFGALLVASRCRDPIGLKTAQLDFFSGGLLSRRP